VVQAKAFRENIKEISRTNYLKTKNKPKKTAAEPGKTAREPGKTA